MTLLCGCGGESLAGFIVPAVTDKILRVREGAVEGGAVDAEVAGDLGFGYPSSDTPTGVVDLLGRQLAATPPPALVDTPFLRGRDPLGLAFTDQGTLELGEGSQKMQHEAAEGIGLAGSVGQALGEELDTHPTPNQVVDEVLEISQVPGQPIHRRDPEGVSLPDVVQKLGKARTIPSGAGDLITKQLVDHPQGLDLAGGILIPGGDPHIPHHLPFLLRHV